jgi:guanylate kinase
MTVEAVIERRLAQAQEELKQIWDYRYALVNDVLDQAVSEMRAIVLTERGVQDGVQAVADSCRTAHPSLRLSSALDSFVVG